MSRVGIAEDTIFFMSDKTPLLWNDRAEFLGEGVPFALRSGDKLDSLPKLANAKIGKPKSIRDTEGYAPSVGHYNLINILVCCDCGLQNSRRYITGAINT